MVKKLITIIVFALLILVSGIIESKYIINRFSGLVNDLESVKIAISVDKENIDSEENIQKMKNIHTDWKDVTSVLKFFVWHTGIKDVEIGLSRITTYTEENDYTEALTELNNLIDYCKHYEEDYKFSLQNII